MSDSGRTILSPQERALEDAHERIFQLEAELSSFKDTQHSPVSSERPIALDEVLLAKLLGVKELDPKDVMSWKQRYAGRVLTDALRDTRNPSISLSNATSWIRHAFERGEQAGIDKERARWKLKLSTLFGL